MESHPATTTTRRALSDLNVNAPTAKCNGQVPITMSRSPRESGKVVDTTSLQIKLEKMSESNPDGAEQGCRKRGIDNASNGAQQSPRRVKKRTSIAAIEKLNSRGRDSGEVLLRTLAAQVRFAFLNLFLRL